MMILNTEYFVSSMSLYNVLSFSCNSFLSSISWFSSVWILCAVELITSMIWSFVDDSTLAQCSSRATDGLASWVCCVSGIFSSIMDDDWSVWLLSLFKKLSNQTNQKSTL